SFGVSFVDFGSLLGTRGLVHYCLSGLVASSTTYARTRCLVHYLCPDSLPRPLPVSGLVASSTTCVGTRCLVHYAKIVNRDSIQYSVLHLVMAADDSRHRRACSDA